MSERRKFHRRKKGAWSCIFLVLGLLLLGTHRLPAPITEESPTPTPGLQAEAGRGPRATPKPKPKPSKGETAHAKGKHTRPEKAAASPTQPTIAQRQVKRFAGTWSGTMHEENGRTYPVTVVVDPTETKATANGPVFANEPGSIRINGNTISWNWMLDSWSMTVNSDTTAQLVKRFLGSTHTGAVERSK